MENKEIDIVTKEFLENGCEKLCFVGCGQMHSDFLNDLGGKGCTRCKARRIKRRYRTKLRGLLKNLDFSGVFKPDSQH